MYNNINMMKKIFGAMILGVFIGVPFFAMANVCIPGDADYDVISCTNSGGTPGTSANPTTGGSPGGTLSNPTTGNITGSTAPSGSTAGVTVKTPLQNPIKYNTFPAFVSAVIATAVNVLMPIVVLAFIWSGFLFVKAQGNQKELETAKTAIWWSVIGAFILMGAWGFAQIIGSTVSTITNVTPL